MVHKTMQECNLIIDKRQVKFLTQKKVSPPSLKAQLKLHKIGIPIQPVINNRTAPAHKLAKHLTKTLNQYIILNNHYNVSNSTKLALDLTKIKIHDNHRMMTFDIKDLYVNIPIEETLNNLKPQLLENNNNVQITNQLLSLLRVTLLKNYFTLQQNIYQPKLRVSMGSPISSLIAEIVLQHSKDAYVKQILDTKNIAFYT